MKIAYYEENNYHTEILGSFLELQNKGHNITVYNSTDKSEWVGFYKKKYNFELKKHTELINNLNNYDKIILGTSTSTNDFLKLLSADIIKSIENKLLYVCHLHEDLGLFDNTKTIVLTPLNTNINNHYILPINNIYNERHVKKNIIIGLIGRFKDNNRNSSDIINLIEKYNQHNFSIYLFARHQKFIPSSLINLAKKYPDHLKIHLKVSTENLLRYFKVIKYLCPLSDNNSIYCKDRLTGILPLSYNFNIPCILNNSIAAIYNINSGIKYQNSISDAMDTIINMSENNYDLLVDKLIEEKHSILQKNAQVLDIILK